MGGAFFKCAFCRLTTLGIGYLELSPTVIVDSVALEIEVYIHHWREILLLEQDKQICRSRSQAVGLEQ